MASLLLTLDMHSFATLHLTLSKRVAHITEFHRFKVLIDQLSATYAAYHTYPGAMGSRAGSRSRLF